MCDTFSFKHGDNFWFAKNSDREPDEQQLVEYIAPKKDDTELRLKTTYLTVDQVPQRYGYLMGRPVWMWGAEMGVNDQGVAIGNQAIFTRAASSQPTALLGMDLVRLGLERANSSDEALQVITQLLERYGQGGPAGFNNKKFRYDNSFLIADQRSLWQLETCGRDWVAKRKEVASISNGLQLNADYHRKSNEVNALEDFSRRQSWFMTTMARAKTRQSCTYQFAVSLSQQKDLAVDDVIKTLRFHQRGEPSSNADICMHAKGMLRPTGTTNSMIAKLSPTGPQVWFTGTSLACKSQFKQASFGDNNSHYFTRELWINHRAELSANTH